MSKRSQSLLFGAAVLGYMGLIFWVSSLSGVKVPLPRFKMADKLAHTAEYGLLAVLLYLFLRNVIDSWHFPVAFAVTVLYGISDELHQSFVPNRHSSMGDIAADVFGAILGLCFVRLCLYFLDKRRSEVPVAGEAKA